MAVSERIRMPVSNPRAAGSETSQRVGETVISLGSVFAAIGAAIGAGACCIIPFGLATLGVSGAWIGNFTALAPYQPYFLGLTAVFLAGGFYLVYRKRSVACEDGSYCARPASDRIAKIGLWSATVLVALAVGFPYLAPLIFDL